MNKAIVNFMPGPVSMHPEVKETYSNTFLSHRSQKFYDDVAAFRSKLCDYTNAQNVAFFVGSGSLGNEVSAMYLKQLNGKGLILVNGEFGRRISEQAREVELDFVKHEVEPGQTFDYNVIEHIIDTDKSISWVWFVHCETSTGVLNNMQVLKKICAKRNKKLAADCVSTIGNIPVDLEGIYIASSTSGKGLSSYPGISIVFYQSEILDVKTKAIPRYLNLKYHSETSHVPFTISTNLFYALTKSFERVSQSSHQQNIRDLSSILFSELKNMGFKFLSDQKITMPGIISIVFPQEIDSYELGRQLENAGYYVNYGGSYLRKANYFQVCLMGHHTLSEVNSFISFMRKEVNVMKEAFA